MRNLIRTIRNLFANEILMLLLLQLTLVISLHSQENNKLLNKNMFSINKDKIYLIKETREIIDSISVTPLVVKDFALNPQKDFLFVILGEKEKVRGKQLGIFKVNDQKIESFWMGEDRKHNPWKILTSEVDGDSLLEVCIGVWKKTLFHPVYDNRLFIYSWDGEKLFPKWLGSRLSSPFLDFTFQDLDGDGINELIALELQRNGLNRLLSYKWQGFGFEGYKLLKENLKEQKINEVEF